MEEAEEIIDDPFLPPPSTAPGALPVSRADRKRTSIMKALEAEKVPKRATGPGKASCRDKGGRRAKE
jgi:hypothetical protein